MILKIDGTAVTRDNVSSLLVGSDIPGSTVTLTVKKGFSNVIDVVLARMATEVIADRRRLFELFTDIKEESPTAAMSSKIDSVINLWTKMTIAEAQHQRKITDGVQRMQVGLFCLASSPLNHFSSAQAQDSKIICLTLELKRRGGRPLREIRHSLTFEYPSTPNQQTDCSKQIDAIAKSLDELQVRLKELPSASTPKYILNCIALLTTVSCAADQHVECVCLVCLIARD